MIKDWPCRWCSKPYKAHRPQGIASPLRTPCGGTHEGFAPTIPTRALSLYAPWDYAIHRLRKDVENRGLNFTKRTGWVWLQASLFGESRNKMLEETAAMLERAEIAGVRVVLAPDHDLVGQMQARRGLISGIVNISGHCRQSKSGWFVGPLGLVLGARCELPLGVPCKGDLGLWQVQPETLTELQRAVEAGK